LQNGKTIGYALNQNNILKKYLFRRDFFWKVKEKVHWFIRNKSRNAFKDQRILLNNLKNGIIFDVGTHVGDTVKLYQNYFPEYKKVYQHHTYINRVNKIMGKLKKGKY
jgi:hypothetical protein